MARPTRGLAAIFCGVLSGCSGSGSATVSPAAAVASTPPSASAVAGGAERTAASPASTPVPLPPYAIEALRARPPRAGAVLVGALLAGGARYTKHSVTWSSMGSTMTGVLDIPAGVGPFPVVVVNHGYVPVGQYYVGQDSSKYGDPLATAGFLTLSPNYPGYAGSGPAEQDVPRITARQSATWI